jgi:Tol biopolymer transport system component
MIATGLGGEQIQAQKMSSACNGVEEPRALIARFGINCSVDDRVNLGALLLCGVPLFTREAAAILHEVCSRLSEAEEEGRALTAPTPDHLWVTAVGDLALDDESACPGDGASSTMVGLAALIEALLPPTIRNQSDYAVPSSFRVLAPRARGFPPGLPLIRTPAELGAAIARYRRGDTAVVLQHLFARTAAAAPAPPVTDPAGARPPESNPAIASTIEAREEPTVAPPTLEDIGDDLPLNTRDDAAWVRPLPPSPAVAPSSVGLRMWGLVVVAAMLVAFISSYEVTRHILPRSEETARADDPAPPAPKRVEATLLTPTHSATPPRAPANPPAVRPRPTPAPSPDPANTRPVERAAAALNRTLNAGNATGASEAPLAAPVPLQTPASTGPVFSPSFAGTGSAVMFHAGRDPVARLMSTEIREPSLPLELVTVVGGDARNYHPRLSPDGRFLAFDSDRDGERGVYVAKRDGTEVRRASGPGFAAVPSWSPGMRALAFVRAEPDRPQVWNLWQLDRATGALSRLTRHRYGQTWGASWFPDSRRLCYSHEDRLIVLDTDDGSTQVFTSPRPGRLVRTPAVSPDGRLVAFQVMRDGVWLLDVDSGTMRRLIDDPSAEEFAWDPAGGRLAYHSRQSGEWRIWIAAAPREIAAAR